MGILIRRTGDRELAEDCVQEAGTKALREWQHTGIPSTPPAWPMEGRIALTQAVLEVLYLLFNEGYSASTGVAPLRASLSDEAIRLTWLLMQLLVGQPVEAEAQALLALMLFHRARNLARVNHDGNALSFEEQDRRLWDRLCIAEGEAALDAARRRRACADIPTGPYELQAAISAAHLRASNASNTDFGTIARLYGELGALTP